jgi:hypothetical protein
MRFYYEHIFIIKKNSFEEFTSSIYGQSVNIFIINGLIEYTISLDNKRCDLYIKNPFSTVNFLLKNNIFNIPYCENFDFYTYYYFFAFQYAIYHGQPLFVHYNENNNDHEYYVEKQPLCFFLKCPNSSYFLHDQELTDYNLIQVSSSIYKYNF